ncbi:IS110 family transposase [Pontibacter qinzhouensis]|uniref:IS110 family transposase n=1 Tax=Pontibacter qinzhouensis TaxID=2603253 RepID=A0A5C8JI19_9BACT|nr:IS110 family transposase [Pontibacter qinzhouensis]TXK36696.1 IS110 family transposase [Pontibacter qinzhouensis]
MATIITKQCFSADMAKDKFDACYSLTDEQQRVKVKSTSSFANSKAFYKWVAKWRLAHVPVSFVMEATGVYYEQLAWFLHQQQEPVSVVVPSQARRYLQSLGHKSKNDKLDAKGLAQLGLERRLPLWQPLSACFYALRKLTREHERLQVSKTGFQNMLHAEQHSLQAGSSTVRRLEKSIRLVEVQLKEIKEEIGELISREEQLARKVQHLTSVPGVGLLTAATVLAETNGFALITNVRQLVSYAGYDVVENQSGSRAGRSRMSKQGNSHIRRILHMPAFQTVSRDLPAFTALYERLLGKGREKMQAYVALQKKLLVLLYTLYTKEQEYERNYTQCREAGAPLSSCRAAAGYALREKSSPA